jgi:transposase
LKANKPHPSNRLAQRPASDEVIKYVHTVYKILAAQSIITTASPAAVLDKCVADVSLLAGILTDKFLYHRPTTCPSTASASTSA